MGAVGGHRRQALFLVHDRALDVPHTWHVLVMDAMDESWTPTVHRYGYVNEASFTGDDADHRFGQRHGVAFQVIRVPKN